MPSTVLWIEGQSRIDQRLITGETPDSQGGARHRPYMRGANLSARIAGWGVGGREDTTLAEIARLLEKAGRHAPLPAIGPRPGIEA